MHIVVCREVRGNYVLLGREAIPPIFGRINFVILPKVTRYCRPDKVANSLNKNPTPITDWATCLVGFQLLALNGVERQM